MSYSEYLLQYLLVDGHGLSNKTSCMPGKEDEVVAV